MMSDAPSPTRHPPGLLVLGATELAERFSYYGMTALLALYMTKQLLLPGHVEHVVGLATLRHVFEFRGPMSNLAFASLIYGWYAGLVYFTPLAGGLLADRLLGARSTVTLGALLMSAGHLAMAFDESFLFALLLLILGSGCLKGNLASQVGTLYPRDAESMRERGFTIFSTAINIGSVAGPLATGGVAASRGFHAGFTVAAGLMLVALTIYLFGQRLLPEAPLRRADRPAAVPLTGPERRRTWAIAAVIALNIPTALSYTMIGGVGILWIEERVSLATPFGTVPSSWFNSIDSFASIVVAAPLIALWAWQARRRREPASLVKLVIGFALTGLSALLLAAGSLVPDPAGKVPGIWALAGYFSMGIAFMWYWPVTLALVARAAPPRLAATLMGCCYMALFVGTVAMGWVGSFYEEMSNAVFWTLDGAISFFGAGMLLLLIRPIGRALEATDDRQIAPVAG